MRELEDHYEEEYIYLADLTCDAALISWGKFFFNSKMKLVEDRKVPGFLRVKALTFAPLDRRLIDGTLLTSDEKAWLRQYFRGKA